MIKWILENKEWIFSGIGIALISSIIFIIKKMVKSKGIKKNDTKKTVTHIMVGDETRITRDISSKSEITAFCEKELSELIAIFNFRAIKIRAYLKELSKNDELKQFNLLHKKHVEALREKRFILAHEIYCDISEILSDIKIKIAIDESVNRHIVTKQNCERRTGSIKTGKYDVEITHISSVGGRIHEERLGVYDWDDDDLDEYEENIDQNHTESNKKTEWIFKEKKRISGVGDKVYDQQHGADYWEDYDDVLDEYERTADQNKKHNNDGDGIAKKENLMDEYIGDHIEHRTCLKDELSEFETESSINYQAFKLYRSIMLGTIRKDFDKE